MFGRRATLPVDINICDTPPSDKLQKYYDFEESDPSDVLQYRQQILEKAKANILKAQAKQKAHCDTNHSDPQYFQVDEQVLKKDFTWKKTRGAN